MIKGSECLSKSHIQSVTEGNIGWLESMREGGLEGRERSTICRDKEILSQKLEPAIGWFELKGSELCTLSSFPSAEVPLGSSLLSQGWRNSIPVTVTVVLTGLAQQFRAAV